MDNETDYTKQLKTDNKNLEAELQKKQSELRVYDRVNFYYSQDEVMFVYYSNQEKYSMPMSIMYLVIFLVLPFTFHVISRFLYKLFFMILQLFNNGNAAYLYSRVPSDQK